MAAYDANPIEVIRYIKIPDRRFISGFLTINCVSHVDNDSLDDAAEEYYTHWNGSADWALTNPWKGVRSADFGRTGYKHTFGDYDSLLFFVSGGMTLHAPSFATRLNQSTLASQNFLNSGSGSASWVDGTGSPSAAYDSDEEWFSSLTHPCQHFVRSNLISRHNNGYGHAVANYRKIDGILTSAYELKDNGDAQLDDDITGEPSDFENHSGSRAGKWNRYISNNGIWSSDDESKTNAIVDLSSDANNTYFPMIEGVEIYGKHDFTIPSHFSTDIDGSGTDGYVYTNGNSTVGNYNHQANFWSLVIKIKIRGYDNTYDGSAGGTPNATHEFFKSRTNVMFQPFGETASFDVDSSLHTS